MIKNIHYCWVGSPTPATVLTQVQRWQELCPDFRCIEWNDCNISASSYSHIDYWNFVYSNKKWAYVSDIVQFSKVYEKGGFYLDCDAYMNKSISQINAPSDHLILGYMYDGVLSGGFMYAPPHHPLLKKILEYYQSIKSDQLVCNNTILTDCLNDNVPDLLLNGKFYTSDKHKLTIFPKEYFCQPSFFKSKPFILDMFAGSWRNPPDSDFITQRSHFTFSKILRRKINCFLSIMRNEFRSVYLNALVGRKIIRKKNWSKLQ